MVGEFGELILFVVSFRLSPITITILLGIVTMLYRLEVGFRSLFFGNIEKIKIYAGKYFSMMFIFLLCYAILNGLSGLVILFYAVEIVWF